MILLFQQTYVQILIHAAIERMVDMTLLMDRPLTNALGKNWREIIDKRKNT